jgi:hypothetical protein
LFRRYVKSVNLSDEVSERNKLIDPDIYDTLLMVLETKFPDEAANWMEWSDDVFFERLLAACPDETLTGSIPGGLSIKDRILGTRINFSVWHITRVVSLQQTLVGLLRLREESEITPQKEEVLVKQFLDELTKYDGGNKAKKRCLSKIQDTGKPKTFKELMSRMHKTATHLNEVCKEAFACGMLDPSVPEHRELFKNILAKEHSGGKHTPHGDKKPKNKSGGVGKADTEDKPPRLSCNVSGRSHGGLCSLRDHPDANHSSKLTWLNVAKVLSGQSGANGSCRTTRL